MENSQSSPKLVFVDTETTGLDPERHEIWEVAAIVRYPNEEVKFQDFEYVWQLPVDESKADLIALNIGRYFERHWDWDDLNLTYLGRPNDVKRVTAPVPFSKYFQQLTTGAHLVGAVPSFDEERLRKLMLKNGVIPAWHYHLVDVESLVAGRWGIQPPWKSDRLWERLDINPNNYEKHTALGDARLARDVYDKVMGIK